MAVDAYEIMCWQRRLHGKIDIQLILSKHANTDRTHLEIIQIDVAASRHTYTTDAALGVVSLMGFIAAQPHWQFLRRHFCTASESYHVVRISLSCLAGVIPVNMFGDVRIQPGIHFNAIFAALHRHLSPEITLPDSDGSTWCHESVSTTSKIAARWIRDGKRDDF